MVGLVHAVQARVGVATAYERCCSPIACASKLVWAVIAAGLPGELHILEDHLCIEFLCCSPS
jgi:hypothetical protein